MKAIAYDSYGTAEVLSLQDLPDPLVGPDSVLIQVRAAGLNPVDYKVRSGYMQQAYPNHFPLIPGWDVAGVVAAVGPAVTRFEPGDEVYGYVRKDHIQHGTYAELAAASERILATKPTSLSFAEAGALPLAGLTALQALRAVNVVEGDVVLVHAASGGVGHLGVQLAKALGAARVIGTASERNHDFVRSLGVEPVAYGPGLVDRVAALVGSDGKVDVALDFAGGDATGQSFDLIRDPSRVASTLDRTIKERSGKYVFVRPDAKQLAELAELADAGKLRVELQQIFPLAEAADAQRLLEAGHVRGKLVLTP